MTADFLRLSGRAVAVTGASSGIGRAVAVAASQAGARVALVARREDELERTVDMLAGDGHLVVPLDVTDHAAIAPAFAEIAAQFGALDGLLHAAGVHAVTPARTITATQSARLLDINVTSALLLAKAFRHPKVRAERSSIVLMSSAAGLVGEAGVSVYSATKAAVAAAGRSLAIELAPEGVRVNAIAAGIVETELTDALRAKLGDDAWGTIESQHPLGLGAPEDVADAALYLLSPASRWVTGTTMVVDGGYTAH